MYFRQITLIALLVFSSNAFGEPDLQTQFDKLVSVSGKEVSNLTQEDLDWVLQKTHYNPISQLTPANVDKYDPEGVFGFCFGRSMTARVLSRQSHLSNQGLYKLFAVGDMRSGYTNPETGEPPPPEWRFHVTTIAQGPEGSWYALDPIFYSGMGDLISLSQWIRRVSDGWDRWHGEGPKLRFYVAPIDSVMPDISIFRLTPEQEDGSRILELNFDPAAQGFQKEVTFLEAAEVPEEFPLYVLNSDQSQKFFYSTEPGAPVPWDFEKIVSNGQSLNFNDYFVDLLNHFSNTVTLRNLSPMGFMYRYKVRSQQRMFTQGGSQ